jgi:hypothetical protein
MLCSKCKKDRARRVERTRRLDHAANRFFLKPYSCEACNYRFYALSRSVSVAAVRANLREGFSKTSPRKKFHGNDRERFFFLLTAVAIGVIILWLFRARV